MNQTGSPETKETFLSFSGSESVSAVTSPSASSMRKRSGGASGLLSTQTSASPSGVKRGT